MGAHFPCPYPDPHVSFGRSYQNQWMESTAVQAPYAEAFNKKTSYYYLPIFKSILIEKCQNKRVRR